MKILLPLIMACLLVGCAAPNRMVYSSGFSFANYDYVVVGKASGENTSTALYGMDVELSNLMSRYNMKVVGDKEYASLTTDVQKRVVFARMMVSASDNRIVLSVTFDDALTGKTGSSITAFTKGDIFDNDTRGEAFEAAAKTLIKALEKDKGLIISDDKKRSLFSSK